MSLPRNQNVELSVFDYVSGILTARYDPDEVVVVENYEDEVREGGLDRTMVASGFNFDDGGAPAETGSTLRVYRHTIEFFVFGLTATWAKNVARVIQSALDGDGLVPLLDFDVAGRPEIDKLLVLDDPGPRVERQIVPDPEPWQQFVWTCTVRFEDTFDAALL